MWGGGAIDVEPPVAHIVLNVLNIEKSFFVNLFIVCCKGNNCFIFPKVIVELNLQQRKINVIVFRTNNLSASK